MTDTSKEKLEPNDQKLVEIPEDPNVTHEPIAHVSTPFDGPKDKPETETDEGKKS